VEDVGKALESAYKSSAEDATKLLKQAGYGAKEISKTLDSAFGKTSKDCEKLLKSAGFSSKDIKGALDDLGEGLSNTGKSIEKGLKGLIS
jgi:uncharacterized protein Smg (DUF494 family)